MNIPEIPALFKTSSNDDILFLISKGATPDVEHCGRHFVAHWIKTAKLNITVIRYISLFMDLSEISDHTRSQISSYMCMRLVDALVTHKDVTMTARVLTFLSAKGIRIQRSALFEIFELFDGEPETWPVFRALVNHITPLTKKERLAAATAKVEHILCDDESIFFYALMEAYYAPGGTFERNAARRFYAMSGH